MLTSAHEHPDSSNNIAQGLRSVRARVLAACARAGRDPSSVELIAVSKTQPTSAILQAIQAGQLHFGENYAQELRDKARELGIGPAVESPSSTGGEGPALPCWHYIGPLQRNKVKYVVGVAVLVHGVDSEALAQAISERSGTHPTPILVQVNVGQESTKSGISSSAALSLCERIHAMPGLSLRGLMAIPPIVEDPLASIPYFQELRALAEQGRRQGLPLHELSMGMSHDFEVAIEQGATLVRVGTAIFGARSYAFTPAS